jgi:hypothetical protein
MSSEEIQRQKEARVKEFNLPLRARHNINIKRSLKQEIHSLGKPCTLIPVVDSSRKEA